MTLENEDQKEIGDFGIFAMANTAENIEEIFMLDLPEEYIFFAPDYILACMPGNGKMAPENSTKITSDELSCFGEEAIKWVIDCGTYMMVSSAKEMEEEDAFTIRQMLDEIEQELLRKMAEEPDKGGEPTEDVDYADHRRNKKHITAWQRR